MFDILEELLVQLMNITEFIVKISIKYLQIGFVYLVFFGSKATVYTIDAFNKICENYPVVEEWVNKYTTVFHYMTKNVHRIFANYRFEPELSPWISITWLNSYNDVAEEYFDFSKDELIDDDTMNIYYNAAIEESKEKSLNGLDGIIIMRHGDTTRCNMIDKYDEKNVYEQSNVKFLAIEYKHSTMTEGLIIELDRSWFLCGNQLLSTVFVRRYLDYQPAPFYFDGKYNIVLIDDNMNITKIDQSQYIVLEKDSYRIIDDEDDEDEPNDDENDSNESPYEDAIDKIDLHDTNE